MISLLEEHEATNLGLEDEAQACLAEGLAFDTLPIVDRGLPDSMARLNALAERADAAIRAGGSVAVHCRAGIGRSGLTAASILVVGGHSPEAAFERIALARGMPVPDTPEQRAWVDAFHDWRRDRNGEPSAASVFSVPAT